MKKLLYELLIQSFLSIFLTNYSIAKYLIRKFRKLASIFKNQYEYSRSLENQIEVLNIK